VPDALYGERMCACVAVSEPVTLQEISEFLRRHGLEPRKFPERLLTLDRLPLGPAGKVDRRVLREQAQQAAE